MKFLIMITFLFFPLVIFGEEQIYYCSEDKVVGFNPSEDYKINQYSPIRFGIKIDFKNLSLSSEKILFPGTIGFSCLQSYGDKNIIYCINGVGSSISFNKNSSNFHRSYIINMNNPTDDIVISYGSCEKF